MALVLNDRVKETTTTTGTGTLTLGGAVTGFETFAAGIGNSNTTYYTVILPGSAEFEVGLGTLNSDSSTIARTTIISSSNSDNAVNFSAGTKNIFCTIPASKSVFLDASGNTSVGADLSVGDDLTVEGGVISFRSNSGSPASLRMYCEVSNAHFQTLQPQPHAASAANTLRLPNSGDSGTQDLVAVDITQTLTNKTLTTPTINGATLGSDNIATASNGDINLAPNGTGKVVIKGNTNQGKIVLNCEANSHGQTIIAAPHSESANNVLTLPSTGGDARLVSTSSTATLTNKTLTTPVIAEITNGSTITLNAVSDIILDAGGANVIFKDDGTEILDIGNSSGDVSLRVSTQDTNFQIKGNDGGSAITALDIDMANAGAATFNNKIIATELDISGDVDIDGTLEADAMTLNGTAITTTATLSTGISNGNVLVATSGVADNDFLRVDGTSIEGRSASEVLSDIGATTASAAADEATALAIALG